MPRDVYKRQVLGIAVPSWAQREGKLSRPLDGLAARFARTHGPFDSEEAAFSLGVGVVLAAESLEPVSYTHLNRLGVRVVVLERHLRAR